MNRPPISALFASVVIHVFGIALVMTVHPSEQLRKSPARVVLIAPTLRAPAPTTHASPTSRPGAQKLRVLGISGPLRAAPRTFIVPDSLPQPVPPKLVLMVPDPPPIQPLEIRSPPPVPSGFDLPAPPPRRVVAATGAFDAAPPSNRPAAPAAITTGTFGNASSIAPGTRSSHSPAAAISSPAEIVSKPRAVYTDEARRLRIEGEVLLQVLFQASGEARVLRMIRGLGHGLDENAMAAARAIRFRPAKTGDSSVDSTAVVHIVFQLAF